MTTKTIIKLTMAIGALSALLLNTARAEDAKAIWTKTCAACHGKDGRGNTRMGQKLGVKDYTDTKVQAELTDEKAAKAIKEGIKDAQGKDTMKPYGDKLSDDEIKSLVVYIRSFKTP